MKIYSEAGSNLQQIGGEKPEGWIEMQSERPNDESSLDYTSQDNGEWGITEETLRAKLVPIEFEWRAATLAMIARQLEALEEVEDGFPPTDLKAGTRAQWRQFRGLVSNWTDTNPDFPDSSKRPVAPS